VIRRLAALACALPLLCAQAIADDVAPVTPGYRPAVDTDEAGLWMMSDQAEATMKSSPLLVKDPGLNAYVKGVACKIASEYCADMRIYILDIPYFNAAMAPNGSMQVWTGLLLRVHNEAQLACILGHEMSHYMLRHTVAEWRRARDTTGAMAVVAILTAGAGVGIVGSLANLVALNSLLSYSRDEERAADANGQDLVYKAGYDPSQCAALWRAQMTEENAEPEHADTFQFLKSHPASQERLDTMQQRAAQMVAAANGRLQVGADILHAATAPFRGEWLREEIARSHFAQSLAVIQNLQADEPNSGLLQFYLGEVYRERNAPDDPARALTAYRAAVADGNAPPEVYRGLGLTEMKSGDKTDASTDFRHYLALAPAADDHAMIQYYLTQLGEPA